MRNVEKRVGLKLFIFFTALLVLPSVASQTIARFKVYTGYFHRINTPVSAMLSKQQLPPGKSYQLYEIVGGKSTLHPFQTKKGNGTGTEVFWLLSGTTIRNATRYFELRVSEIKKDTIPSTIRRGANYYLISSNERRVLKYVHTPKPLIDGQKNIFASTGFIHPIFAPSGKVLTALQPEGHPHHKGVWQAWTRTRFQELVVDFWNLDKNEGRVDYNRTLEIIEGEVFTSLSVNQHHVVFKPDGITELALDETLEITVYHLPGNFFIIDHVTTFKSDHPGGLILDEFRYGGFAFRGNSLWDPSTVRILTSEGKSQVDGDGVRARWCLVNETTSNPSGVILMTHPQNFNHPEPLRIWNPETNRGRNNIFINFCPVRDRSWHLRSNENNRLKYRIITFDGVLHEEIVERLWRDFAFPPTVVVF